MRCASILFIRAIMLLLPILLLSPEAGSAELDGMIEPHMVVNVGSGVAGIIEKVTVDRGDFVKKGQVLVTLQSGVEEATMELARARAEMEAAIMANEVRLEFDMRKQKRTEELYKKEAVSFYDMDEAETSRNLAEWQLRESMESRQLAELELRQAIEVLERRTIRSPVTGVVVERFLHPGEFVEDQPVLKIAQIDRLNVEVIVPVDLLGSIKVGMRGKVKPEGPLGGVYTAAVKIVDLVVDAASGTFGVRLELPNANYRLPVGVKCKVLFTDK